MLKVTATATVTALLLHCGSALCGVFEYDLSALQGLEFQFSPDGSNTQFALTPCSESVQCFKGSYEVSSMMADINDCDVVANWKPDEITVNSWTRDPDNNGVTLTVVNGDPCGNSTEQNGLNLNFVCDRRFDRPSASGDIIVSKAGCVYNVNFPTCWACSEDVREEVKCGETQTQPIGGGVVFVVVLLCLVTVYIVFGIGFGLYRGKSGIEAFPNINFWRRICACCQGSSSNYAAFGGKGTSSTGQSTSSYGGV